MKIQIDKQMTGGKTEKQTVKQANMLYGICIPKVIIYSRGL